MPAEPARAGPAPARPVPAEQASAGAASAGPVPAEAVVVGFAQALREAGLAVPVGASVTFARGLATGAPAYWAGRATLVRRHEDVPAYDRVFAAYFDLGAGPGAASAAGAERTVEVSLPVDDGDDGDDGAEDEPEPGPRRPALRWSAVETLQSKDFAACTPDELHEAYGLVRRLRLHPALRPGRRPAPDRRPRAGGRPDLRRTVGAALRNGGELGRPVTTSRRMRPRRVVLLLDVSGSMAPYARALARFANAVLTARRRGEVEVFALGTRLTRVTRELAGHDPDHALARAASVVADWDGGTRLGDGIRRFNDDWGVRGVARGAVVVVLSDGWDRGDPSHLAGELARLRRVAHRLVWVNPLKASPGYAPLAGGMAAALPHLDEFVEGHSVDALAHLADVLAADRPSRPAAPDLPGA